MDKASEREEKSGPLYSNLSYRHRIRLDWTGLDWIGMNLLRNNLPLYNDQPCLASVIHPPFSSV